uniref:Uncharacterized protein n=1 Tax=Arundo donax TaxID=35708 RepID=A0A0A9GFE7_ARUDO
MRRPRRAASPT